MSRNLIRSTLALAVASCLFAAGVSAQQPPQGERNEARHAQMQAKRDARQAELMQRLDSDGNGSISQAEVDAAAAAHAAEVDANGDGQIASEEVSAYRDAKRAEARERREQNGMKRVDADADGSVSTEEFAAAHAQRLQRMDSNSDGVIEAAELAAPARHGGRRNGPRGG